MCVRGRFWVFRCYGLKVGEGGVCCNGGSGGWVSVVCCIIFIVFYNSNIGLY
jgi:hypothetical protein